MFNVSDLHLYGKAKLQEFAETLNIEGYEDMDMSMLREALEEEDARLRALARKYGIISTIPLKTIIDELEVCRVNIREASAP